MSKILYLMQGLPGSGKSTIAGMIATATEGVICSTDDLWYDEDGIYQWDANKAGEKHAENQRRVADAMVKDEQVIIVDNTNLTKDSIQPYLVMAKAFEYEVTVVRVETPVEVCLARQENRPEDRRIPEVTIVNMKSRMQDLDILKWKGKVDSYAYKNEQ